MSIQFTRNGRKAMLWAQVEAMRRGDLYVEREHLLLGLLHGESTGALRLIERLGYAPEEIRLRVACLLKVESAAPRVESSQLSPLARKVVEQARRETESTGHDFVGTEHLLLALLHEGEVTNTGETIGISYDSVANAIANGLLDDLSPDVAPTPASVVARPGFLRGRHFVAVDDLSTAEIEAIFELTREIKLGRGPRCASGKTVALLFEKPSLRTKVTFTVAAQRLGADVIYLSRDEVGLGKREAVKDVARGLSRWVDAAVIRTFQHGIVEELAQNASIPIINALTDAEHPCQALADYYTILEHRSTIRGQKIVYLGDGNNVAISLLLLAPRLGAHFTLACPPGYEPPTEVVARARALAAAHHTNFEIVEDPLTAADDADVIYTDVWTSMGQEDESDRRLHDFAGYQVNARVMREAKEDALVLHCLPAHRGEEITDEVLDGPLSKVFDQAENRLHVQQALLAAVL